MNNYDEIWKSVHKSTTETALTTAWLHWSALGANAYQPSRGKLSQVVDPEALILLSLAFGTEEPRLYDMVEWWAAEGAPQTSVHRLKSILSEFGESGRLNFAMFSAMAADSGHRSWKRYANYDLLRKRERSAEPQNVSEPVRVGGTTLMVRMRAAFGTGAKADVLSYLVSSRDNSATVAAISRAVGYTKTSVRDALTDILRSGIIHESSGRPIEYSTNKRAWMELLRIQYDDEDSIPKWCLWTHIFGFLVRVKELMELAQKEDMNEHLLASKCRDISDRYKHAFAYHSIIVPEHSKYPGRAYAEGFLILCQSLADWISQDARVAESE